MKPSQGIRYVLHAKNHKGLYWSGKAIAARYGIPFSSCVTVFEHGMGRQDDFRHRIDLIHLKPGMPRQLPTSQKWEWCKEPGCGFGTPFGGIAHHASSAHAKKLPPKDSAFLKSLSNRITYLRAKVTAAERNGRVAGLLRREMYKAEQARIDFRAEVLA